MYNGYAPIIIPTLNRYEHLKRCVESLSANTGADKTELIIGLDYPPSEKYIDGYNKVKEYVTSIKGFKKVTVLTTEVNLNAYGNFNRLIDYVKNEGYETYVFTEDDNEFSPSFLSYCNWALDYFKNDKSILFICGYNLVYTPHIVNNLYKYNHAFCAWGVATWMDRRRREQEVSDFGKMKEYVDAMSIWDMFNAKKKSKVSLASSLLYMIKNHYVLMDTATQAIPDKYRWCVFPKLSMVRNYGHDGSGVHSGSLESYQRQINLPIDESTVFEPHIEGDLFTPEIAEAYKAKYGKKSFVYRLRCMGRFLVYKLTGIIIILERPKWLKRKKK